MQSADASSKTRAALLHRVFWRLHFWAGLLTAPIILFAALTGALYAFTPQIEAWKYSALDQISTPGVAPALSLDRQLAAAQAALPNQTVRMIVPAYQARQTTQVYLEDSAMQQHPSHAMHAEAAKAEHAAHSQAKAVTIAYVNPTNANVQGSLPESGRFRNWSRKLHSAMLQGEGWRWIMELGASWMVLMLMTGIYLWWPRGNAGWRSVLRQPGSANARAGWRYLHGLVAIAMSLMTMTILLTGLTWSKYAGDNFRLAQNAMAQNAPRAPRVLQSIQPAAGMSMLPLQAVYDKLRAIAPEVQLQITPPRTERGVWRAENYDRSQPQKRFQVMLDAYTGAILFQSGWEQLPLLAKATAVGIPFHRGEFGWWNQALLLLVAASAVFSVVSGYAMWWKRRRAATISAPKVRPAHLRAIPWQLALAMLVLACALPALGISLLLLLTLEAMAALTINWHRTV
ncbi:MAG: PepSY domain-containing protein [Pseudomonadota bacterium]